MATILCPQCREAIDNLWLTCPLCGVKTPVCVSMEEIQLRAGRGQLLRHFIVVLILILIFWVLSQMIHNFMEAHGGMLATVAVAACMARRGGVARAEVSG